MSTGNPITLKQKKLFYILAATLGALIVAYIGIVGTITFHIVDRKSTTALAQEKATVVSNLEEEYLSLVDEVDIAYAQETLGFTRPENVYYTSPNVTVVRNFDVAYNEI